MIPDRMILSDEQSFPVVQKPLGKKLGYFDRSTGEIALDVDQPEAGKHVILLHEMMHFVAEILVQQGSLKKHPPEAFIENASPILLAILVRSGLYNGLSDEALTAFAEEQLATIQRT